MMKLKYKVMAKGFAIHNALTDHGGFVPATQMSSSQMGNLFVVAGDGHFCPKCKCWSTVIKSHDHVIFDGKSVAYVGDQLTCGARIQPQQSHVVGDSGNTKDQKSNVLQPRNILNAPFQAQFKCLDKETGKAFSNRKYFIIIADGSKKYGITDKNGLTELIETSSPQNVSVHFYFTSPSGELITIEDIEE